MSAVKLKAITQPVEDMTPEQFIAYCARVSSPQNQHNHLTGPKLVKYLIEHQHWSPLEMVNVVMEIQTTRDIARQILRHRSFAFQEFSQRYAVSSMIDQPREARLQDTKNRQNSLLTDDADLQKWWADAQKWLLQTADTIYSKALERGIAKEVARAVLPEGLTNTTLYMSGSARSWIHYIKLRTDPSTQAEHRYIAKACMNELFNAIPSLKEVI
jgi:thymidylate synthase (FAD)